MNKQLRNLILFAIACVLIGIGLGIAIMVLQQRTGIHVGGEFLVFPAMAGAVYAGMHLGARLATWAPSERKDKAAKVWLPYWR